MQRGWYKRSSANDSEPSKRRWQVTRWPFSIRELKCFWGELSQMDALPDLDSQSDVIVQGISLLSGEQ